MKPRMSIVIPAYNEGAGITEALDRVLGAVTSPCEILVVYDTPGDTTVEPAAAYATKDPRVVPTLNTYGRGPAHAIAFGMDHATADVVVVSMADGSDDVTKIETLVELVERGAAVACASRYSRGGRQIGGPRLKGLLSRAAGMSLHLLARVGTRDATNSFKAYSKSFLSEVRVESDAGFELGIELVSKAHRLGYEIAEIPAIWRDRTEGESNFKLWRWLPRYVKWYLHAFGPRRKQPSVAGGPKVSS